MNFKKKELEIINSALIYYAMSLTGDQLLTVKDLVSKTDNAVNQNQYNELKELASSYKA